MDSRLVKRSDLIIGEIKEMQQTLKLLNEKSIKLDEKLTKLDERLTKLEQYKLAEKSIEKLIETKHDLDQDNIPYYPRKKLKLN